MRRKNDLLEDLLEDLSQINNLGEFTVSSGVTAEEVANQICRLVPYLDFTVEIEVPSKEDLEGRILRGTITIISKPKPDVIERAGEIVEEVLDGEKPAG